MGEYVFVNGRQTKIGTCEELGYVRWLDLMEWHLKGQLTQAPNCYRPDEYLRAGTEGFLFRFPHPDEDGIYWHINYDRKVEVGAPKHLLEELRHNPGCNYVGDRLAVRYEKPMDDGLLWTVVECPQCGSLNRLHLNGAEALCSYMSTLYANDLSMIRLASRIMEGYTIGQNLKYALINRFGTMDSFDRYRAFVAEIKSKATYLGRTIQNISYYELGGMFFCNMSVTQFQYIGTDLMALPLTGLIEQQEREPQEDCIIALYGALFVKRERTQDAQTIKRLTEMAIRLSAIRPQLRKFS